MVEPFVPPRAASDADDLRRRLADLKVSFVGELGARLARINALVARLGVGWDTVQGGELRMAAHGLKGSAGSFGFEELSERAGRLERTVIEALSAEPPGPAALAAIVEAATEVTKAGRNPIDTQAPPPARVARVLALVAGDEAYSHFLALQLRAFGFKPAVIHDEADLRAVVDELSPAAIVIDGTGEATSRRNLALITSLQATHPFGLPCVMIGTLGDFSTRLAAVQAGVDTYLVRPVEVDDIVTALGRLATIAETAPYRVLVVAEDEAAAAATAARLASPNLKITTSGLAPLILDLLEEHQPEVLILHGRLFGCSGAELAQVVHQIPNRIDLPILILCRDGDPLPLGAGQALDRDGAPERIVAVTASAAERRRVLHASSELDPLTRLLRRTVFESRLEDELSRARRHRRPLTLALIDLDGFRQINDDFGYGAGDSVLKRLALMLRQRLRRTDVIGRIGGDSVGIVLAETEPAVAFDLCDRLRQAFADFVQGTRDGTFYTTLSCGLAAFPAYRDASDLARAAARALLAAKAEGGDRTLLESELKAEATVVSDGEGV